jgi:type IV pilus assembly protein PilA
MSTQWHYADRNHQQQGPVGVDWLQAAFGRGEIGPQTLVWREGLAGWVALAQVAPELGLALPAAAVAPVAAPRPPAIVARKGGTSVLVIVLIVGFALIAVLGVLAAISIPAYQDYTVRAKVSSGIARAYALKETVQEVWFEHERCAENGSDQVGTPGSYGDGIVQGITLEADANADGACTIVIDYGHLRGGGEVDTLTMSYDGVNWSYRSTLPPRYLPASLRNEVVQE